MLDSSGRLSRRLRLILHRRSAPLRLWLWLHALRLLRVPDYRLLRPLNFSLTLLLAQSTGRLHLLTHALSLRLLSGSAFGALLLNLLPAKFLHLCLR